MDQRIAFPFLSAEQFGQPRDIDGDAARFIAHQEIGGSAPAGLVLEIDYDTSKPFASFTMKQALLASSNARGRRKAAVRH